jgi:hypothetical protein
MYDVRRARSHDIEAAGYSCAAPGWAGQHTEYVAHDVQGGQRQGVVGGPWLDVALPPGTEITLTLRLRTRVRPPSVRTRGAPPGPWRHLSRKDDQQPMRLARSGPPGAEIPVVAGDDGRWHDLRPVTADGCLR